MDSYIKDFESKLLILINNANLPAGVVYYILKDMSSQVEKIYNQMAQESDESSSEPKGEAELNEKSTS